jgi:SprT-like family
MSDRDVFANSDDPVWPGQSEAEHAIREIAQALDTSFFAGRLNVRDTVKFRWLPPDTRVAAGRVMGLCARYDRVVSLNPNVIATPQRRPLIDLLLHELCHVYTRAEAEQHGKRWQAVMRRCGYDPLTGSYINSTVDQWIAVHITKGARP